MTIQESYNLDSPLTYIEWRKIVTINKDFSKYTKYVQEWYDLKNKTSSSSLSYSIKQEYIQLIKDIIESFEENERNLFFEQIDLNNDEDILKVLPYCARKLKFLSKKINIERKNLQFFNSQIKEIGSADSIKKEIYNFVLKNYTDVVDSSYPSLSEINEKINIEIEELFEDHPETDIAFSNIKNLPFEKFEFAEKNNSNIFSLPKIANSPLSLLFNKFLNEKNITDGNNVLNLQQYIDLYIKGNENLLGEDQYAIDALKVEDTFQNEIKHNFVQGNNWFYWISGGFYLTEEDGIKGNHYEPIPINESNLSSIAQSGDSYLVSDLIFADKNGKIEGAWYKGSYKETKEQKLQLTINNSESVEFLYPWVGYELNSKNFTWKDYALKPLEPKLLNNISSKNLESLTKNYFSNFTNNTSAGESLFINKSTLVANKAYAAKTSDYADTVIKIEPTENFVEATSTKSIKDIAYLYKFEHTNIPISSGVNNILWPLGLETSIIQNRDPILYSEGDVMPIHLGHVHTGRNMTGAVAGLSWATADIIYKNTGANGNSSTAIEAAWLKGMPVSNLRGSSINKYALEKKDRRGKQILNDFYDVYLIYPSGGIIEYNVNLDTYEFLEATYNDVPVAGMPLSKFVLEIHKRDKNLWKEAYLYYEYISQVEDLPYSNEEPAVGCCSNFSAAIQPSLSFRCNAGEFVTFIWCGPDTYADDVFKFRYHSSDCEYFKLGSQDYYNKRDYLDLVPLNSTPEESRIWEKCNCRCVQWSPIGHSGKNFNDYKTTADLLFADPLGYGSSFNHKTWSDTRGYNAFNSPQFAFFQLENNELYDQNLGFGPGKWKVSSKDPTKKFILQTGKSYTYKRSKLLMENSTSLGVAAQQFLYFICQHPYVSIQDNFVEKQQCLIENISEFNDIVLVIDQSYSMSINKRFGAVYNSIFSLIHKILPSTNSNNLLSLIGVSNTAAVIKPLTNRSFDIINGIEQIKNNIASYNLNSQEETSKSTILKSGLKAAYDLLKNSIQISEKSLSVINSTNDKIKILSEKATMECSNVELLIRSQYPSLNFFIDNENQSAKYIFNSKPRNKAKKKIILISDGINTGSWEELITISNTIKKNNVDIYCIDVNEIQSNNLKSICNNSPKDDSVVFNYYFHLKEFLNITDSTYEEFGDIFYRKLTQKVDLLPRWCKILKTNEGWVPTDEISDLTLDPGYYYSYEHRGFLTLIPPDLGKNATTSVLRSKITNKTTSFTINLKLTGWDYENSKPDPSAQNNVGAKPYWAKVDLDTLNLKLNSNELRRELKKETSNFYKWSIYYGGHQRWHDYYLPIDQPLVSDLTFDNNYIYRYIHNNSNRIEWEQPVSIISSLSSNEWKKLILKPEISNLKDLAAKHYSLMTFVVSATDQPSDLTFESYSNFKPVFYNYYKKDFKPSTWSQPLQIKNWCKFLYSKKSLQPLIKANNKIANLLNRNNATVAVGSDENLAYSLKEYGGYMTPDKNRVSTYKECGSKFLIEEQYILNNKDIFPDPLKYTNFSMGLSKDNNYAPIKNIKTNENWFINLDFSEKNGKILYARNNQSLYPYVTYFEQKNQNFYGINYQHAYEFFWKNGIWTKPLIYPQLKNKKISKEIYEKRVLDNENNENLGPVLSWNIDVNNINYVLINNNVN